MAYTKYICTGFIRRELRKPLKGREDVHGYLAVPTLRFPEITMSSSSGPTTQQTEGSDLEIRLDVTDVNEFVVVNLILPIFAAAVTLFRLFERMRLHRLWLDDAWAMLAMVLNTIFLVADWLYLHNYGNAIVVLQPEECR